MFVSLLALLVPQATICFLQKMSPLDFRTCVSPFSNFWRISKIEEWGGYDIGGPCPYFDDLLRKVVDLIKKIFKSAAIHMLLLFSLGGGGGTLAF